MRFLILVWAMTFGCGDDDGVPEDGAMGDAQGDDDDDADDDDDDDDDSTPPTERPDVICDVPEAGRLVDTSGATNVVGHGLPTSCTEDALRIAIAQGGHIVFDCGDAPHTIVINEEIVVPNTTPDVVIDGGGLVTLSGGGRSRILKINSCENPVSERCDIDPVPRVTVQRLVFRDGLSMDSAPRTKDTDTGGAAIFRHGGTLTVIDCDFMDNTCDTLGQDVSGGAITSQQSQTTLIVGSTFRGNRCANGGAIGVLQATLRVFNSVIEENEATGTGGNRVPTEEGDTGGNGGNGGGIVADGQNNEIELCGVRLVNNTAHYAGGGLFRTGYHGERFVIDRSAIDGNHLDRLAFEETDADNYNVALGGGLYLQGVSATIHASSIAENETNGGAAGLFAASMGPVNVVDMTNVTIAGNQVEGTGIGGGVFNSGVTGTLRHCTIADNGANFAGGLVGGGFTLVSTLVAGNRRDDEDATGMYNESSCFCPGDGCALTDGGHVVQWPRLGLNGREERACVSGVTFMDPQLGALGDHGGPTRTMIPASTALEIGEGCPATDQRGNARPSSGCTVGAVELE